MQALEFLLTERLSQGAAIYDVEGAFWWTVVQYEPGRPVIDFRTIKGVETSLPLDPSEYTLIGNKFAVIKGCTENSRAFVNTFPMTEKVACVLAEAMILLAAKHGPIIDEGANPNHWFRARGVDLARIINIQGIKIALSHPEHVGRHVCKGREHGLLLHGVIARIGHVPTTWERVLDDTD